MTDTASHDWLSIREASRLLGVHIATARTWANSGVLPSYRTPGGHRRFALTDLRKFLEQRQHDSKDHKTLSLREHALGHVRRELQEHPLAHETWFQNLSFEPLPQQRAQQREFGQRLLECVIAYVEEPDRREFLLKEGCDAAHEYGRVLMASGLSAGNAARATIHFRQLICKTVLELKMGARVNDEEDARLFQRISSFLDEMLLAILEVYP